MTEQPTLGLIGLGIMGRPMGHNLLKAGYKLVVGGRSRAAAAELAEAGATRIDGHSELASACDVLITMLPDSSDVEEVYAGRNGAFEALRPGWLAIDMSSISPRVSRELAARAVLGDADFLDAPVSGGEPGAVAGTLSIMVGGSEEAYSRVLPILQAVGKTIVYCGPSGAGQVVKLANQVVVAVVIEAVSEALVLGAKAGVDPRRIVEVLQGGLAATKVLDMRQSNFLEGSFTPGFKVRLHLKDLKNAFELAREVGVTLPAAAATEQLLQAARVAGHGDSDHSSLITVLEGLADLSLRDAVRNATDNPPADTEDGA